MADNCSSLEPWSFRSPFTDISDAFTRETDVLTRALQMSFSTDTDVLAAVFAGGSPSLLVQSEPTASLSASDAEIAPKRIRNPVSSGPAGKISKRKSRPSKRLTTTYITADPANFRQMVQQVTGIRFGGPHEAVEAVLKPEPQRPGGGRVTLPGSCLPTLDTSSSFLLDRPSWTPVPSAAPSPPSHGSLDGGGFGLDPPFSCFPTLESWGVM